MAKETVLVGCRLPNGLVLHHPANKEVTVTLKGAYEQKTESGIYYPPRPYSTTVVDAEFWAAWKAAYTGYPPLKTRAVFEARNDQEAAFKAKEVESVKTGFEGTSRIMKVGAQTVGKASD